MFFTKTEALTHDASRWDRLRWGARVDSHGALRNAERDLTEMIRENVQEDNGAKLAHTFGGEVFARLCEDPATIEGADSWASRAQSIVSDVPEFEALRAAVANDPDMAALATKEILSAVSKGLPAILAADKVKEQEQDGQDGQEQGNPGQPGQGAPAPGQGDQDGGDAPQPGPSREEAAMRSVLRRAIGAATQEITDAREALEGLAPGMGSTPASHEQEDTTRLTLASMLLNNPAFREVLRRAGKLRRMAASDAKRRAPGVGTMVGLERGADLGRVLPSELARLSHPTLRLLAFKGIAERSLMQYKVESHEPQGRGPIVVLVDESGSMAGDSTRWAKAAVIAAIRQGQAEGRSVSVAFFDTEILAAYNLDKDGRAHNLTTSAPVESTGIFGKTQDVIRACLTRGIAGGTDFTAPISWALDILENGDDRADIILVTDGEANISEDALARLTEQKERGARLYALTVGAGNASALEGMATEVLALDRIPENEIADRLARAVPTSP